MDIELSTIKKPSKGNRKRYKVVCFLTIQNGSNYRFCLDIV